MKKIFQVHLRVVLFLSVALLWSCSKDEGCNTLTWYEDADADGRGNPEAMIEACEQPLGYVSNNEDTDDGCVESTWYEDADEDGFGNANAPLLSCEQPNGYVSNDSDADDTCPETTWYEDADEDGRGNPEVSVFACAQPDGYIDNAEDEDDTCAEIDWYLDADGDGLGNPEVSLLSCTQPDGYVDNNLDEDDSTGGDVDSGTPTAALDAFDSNNVIITIVNEEITIESNGLPNHTSPYWPTTNSLYIDPVVASVSEMSPGQIREGSYTMTVPLDPQLASQSTATGLGAIGIAVSGVPIFNDEEGPNVALSATVASGFDYAGGHNGPTGYHYHLEAQDVDVNTSVSVDDDQLIGMMEDGFLLYGRKCHETGDYPADLDESGGHIGATQHSDGRAFYHYHVINEVYESTYYLLFGEDFKGTPYGVGD